MDEISWAVNAVESAFSGAAIVKRMAVVVRAFLSISARLSEDRGVIDLLVDSGAVPHWRGSFLRGGGVCEVGLFGVRRVKFNKIAT
ncbi:MAG TPA: hypothetical protein DD423_08145 [Opitutae bacterium]|nr:hypothetical protein [Opitutae bacterium]